MVQKWISIVLSVLFFTAPSFADDLADLADLANVQTDRAVQNFLHETKKNTDEKLSVYITYRINAGAKLGNSPAEIESALRSRVVSIEQRVFAAELDGDRTPRTTYWIANASETRLNRRQIRALLKNRDVRSIVVSGRASHLQQESLPVFTYGLEAIKIPEVRQSHHGLLGKNIRVGIIDTGADPAHPDLAGKIKLYRDYITPSITEPRDDHGHGTHVAGTISGGATSGTAIGVAPQVDLLIAKGFDAQGNSVDQQLIAALQWMADPDGNPNTADAPRVVSCSWNSDVDMASLEPADEPFCNAVHNLRALGIAPVFAAGNDGPEINTVKAPGACPDSITVAAVDERNEIASFSSRGPAKWKTTLVAKPDVSAPGVEVYSADLGGRYITRSGTSMATPHVAGALAVLTGAKPQVRVDELVQKLMTGALDDGSGQADPPTRGAGRIDTLKSLRLILGE